MDLERSEGGVLFLAIFSLTGKFFIDLIGRSSDLPFLIIDFSPHRVSKILDLVLSKSSRY